jgi:hypothetical protein
VSDSEAEGDEGEQQQNGADADKTSTVDVDEKEKKSKQMNTMRLQLVLRASELIADYNYDTESDRWCTIVFQVPFLSLSIFISYLFCSLSSCPALNSNMCLQR